MEYFVEEGSIVREIWGTGDTVLFIFAGASAEFALNKAVDWLYYTGRLPADPLKRLFSTISYARQIVFAPTPDAHVAIDKIVSIHSAVETSRGFSIPDWAYRDVLFMLIHYSIASFELMERKLSAAEKEEVYDVFLRLGTRMKLKDLPANFIDWQPVRQQHLQSDLGISKYSIDLYNQYKKHLGLLRYKILLESQICVVPGHVNALLRLGKISWVRPLLGIYKLCRKLRLEGVLKYAILPGEYRAEIKALDIAPRLSTKLA